MEVTNKHDQKTCNKYRFIGAWVTLELIFFTKYIIWSRKRWVRFLHKLNVLLSSSKTTFFIIFRKNHLTAPLENIVWRVFVPFSVSQYQHIQEKKFNNYNSSKHCQGNWKKFSKKNSTINSHLLIENHSEKCILKLGSHKNRWQTVGSLTKQKF